MKDYQVMPPLAAEEYEELKNDIARRGVMVPVEFDEDGNVLDGHHRLRICEELGITDYPKVIRAGMSEEEKRTHARKLNMARRQLNREQRQELIRAQLLETPGRSDRQIASALGVDHKTVSAKRSEMQRIGEIPQSSRRTKDGRIYPAERKPVSIFNPTSREEKAIQNPAVVERMAGTGMTAARIEKQMRLEEAKRSILEQNRPAAAPTLYVGNGIGYIPAEPYDLLLTDPPYSTDVEDIGAFVDSWLYNALSHVKATGFAYVFIGAYPGEVRAYLNAALPEHMRLEQILVWTYKNTLGQNPKDRYKLNYQNCLFFRGIDAPALDCPLTNEQWAVQEINAPDGRQGDRYHPWQKPMEIAERFIRHSTKAGMTVFDPFSCTGTFLLAAAKLGRKAYGFEIDINNAGIAEDRGCLLSTETAF